MTEGTNNMYMPVVPQGFGGNGGFGFDGNNGWWILILLILFGWNGNGGWGMNNGGVGSEVQRGFDQNSIMAGLSGIRCDIANGQAAAANQNFTLQSAMQNCCCENRLATADLKYTVANEGSTTRQANAANTQAILDKLCQLEMDNMKQNYEGQLRAMQTQLANAQAENQSLRFAASQGAQTAQIMANNEAQTVALERYLAPTPIPAYTVQNPNCCQNQFQGCGCGNM
ncbi:MAG: hypothetical protein J6W76_01730 [Spirochaetales bacterium]|nr:hypothetical protein [Spirochaetales bacterium]